MRNPFRGEVSLVIDGEPCELRLTLGAIAALEDAIDCQDLPALIERFAKSQYQTNDIIMVLNAGLYGAGISKRVEDAKISGGAKVAAAAAIELLKITFVEENKFD